MDPANENDAGRAPLSYEQERMYLFEALGAGATASNLAFIYWITGDLDVPALTRAIGDLHERHAILRTRYPSVSEQVVLPPAEFSLPVHDLRRSGAADGNRAGADPAGEVLRIVDAEVDVPFDLAAAPPVRWSLYVLGPDRYALTLLIHHIATDAWSRAVITRDLSALYRAHHGPEATRPAAPPGLPVRYADYAAEQRARAGADDTGYWVRRLAGAPSGTALPVDRPPEAGTGYRGASSRVPMARSLIETAERLGRRERASLFMVLFAAFGGLLAAYGGRTDLVLGVPSGGRADPDLENVVGCFVNTMPLRMDLSGEPTFRELLARVRDAVLDGHDHADVPLERVVAALRPDREPGREPLVQVTFGAVNTPPVRLELPGARVAEEERCPTSTGVELAVIIVAEPDGTTGLWEYKTELFEPATIARMQRDFEQIASWAVANPDTPLSACPVTAAAGGDAGGDAPGDGERALLLGEWNDTARPAPEGTLPELFAAQVRRSPGAVAVVAGDTELTYARLDELSGRLARRLTAEGAGPEARVGVLMERSPAFVVAELAIVRAGAAYLPLDARAPLDRRRRVVAEAGCGLLLTDRDSAESAAEIGCERLIVVDPEDPGPAAGDRVAPPVSPDNLAYVMYTSGSTGVPKGVSVRHRDVVARALDSRVGGEFERVLLHSPLAFDASTYELWVPLLNGGSVVIAPPGELDTATLADTITAHRVTGLWLTAGLFGLVSQLAPRCLAGVREVWIGGEVIPPAVVRRVLRACPDLVVVNAYGPTETTVHAAAHRMAGLDAVPDPLLIGRALDNTRVHVLDGELRLVRPGVVGELYIAGAGLARGYLGRPGLTAERFLPDPFGPPGSRMYHSGDLARWTAGGQVEFAGRADRQVKLRGFRIELGEIEAALAACPGVAQALVVAREDDPGAKRLVAYLVATPGRAVPAAGELRALLGRSLPDYMLPAAFVVLDALPLTRNGKFDRAALPAPPVPDSGMRAAAEPVEPRTEPERFVARIWSETLEVARVGVEDDFYELGGHSLTAARIVARVGELVPGLPTRGLMRDVLRNPTVARFAAVLAERVFEHVIAGVQAVPADERGDSAAGHEGAHAIPVISRDGTVPLSLGQKRLWFLDQFVAHEAEYVVPFVLRVRGALDVAALDAALREIVRRHEILRTSVVVDGDELAGRIRDAGEFTLAVREVSSPDGVVAAEVARPFDLEHGLPVRAVLLRSGASDPILCLCFHHMVFDGWSAGILFDELAALYRAFTAGDAPPLAPVDPQYADVTAYQESRQRGPRFAAKLDFWRAELDGAEAFELAPDLPRPARRTAPGASRSFTVPEHVTEALEDLGNAHGATLFMTLLTAWQTLLYRYSGLTDITLGTTAAERDLVESEPLIGLFINMLVLRGDVAGDPAFTDLLERTRDRTVEAYAHQDVPFDRLVEELSPERDLSRTPIFQIMIKLNNARQRTPELPGLTVEALPTPPIPAKYDLELEFTRGGDGLTGELTYDTGLYTPGTIDRLVRHLGTLLAGIAADPGTRIDDLPLIGPAERLPAPRPLIDFPACGLHVLFEEQAAATPDAAALVQDGEEITYAELDAWANRVAGLLRGHGAGPDVVTGVLLDRSPAMVAGLLGVLKAGSAYLPIETETPPARIARLLRDSRAPVCLTGMGPAGTGTAAAVAEAGCRPLPVPDRPGPGVTVPYEPVSVHPDNLVAIYYTSGSTGAPKGVACTHGGWVNRMAWMGRHHPLSAGETVLHKTTLTFDDAAVEIFWPLLSGARVALLGPGLHRDPRAIADAAIRYGAVHVQFVPSVLELFLDTLTDEDARRLGAVRSVLSSGEALRPALVRRFRERFGDRVTLDNTWGATEVSIDSTCRVCRAEDGAGEGGAVSVGVPIDNNEVIVLDHRMEPVPDGMAGELCIGGLGLARGYLGDPRRTAEAFVPHPDRPGERVYRTGDQGRLGEDGSVTFLNRRDDQVKVRGVRIELGEVEHVLRAHPGVADAAVIAWEAVPGDKRLAAYVVAGDGADCPPAAVLAHARALLPGYAVPGSIAVLAALPRHSNGKLDKRALPPPDPRSVQRDAYVAPRTPAEEVLAEIWTGVLGLDRMSVHDDFFLAGGHSLLATRAIGRMREAFAAELPLTLMFEHPTPAGAAAAIEEILLAEISQLSDEEARQMLG